nr:hypothetical protein [Bifidobacterium canis]
MDTIDLPAGRAAYSTDTLNKLTERMLTTDDDLHAARKVLFNVDDNWRPPQPAIGAPLGNASVDRVLKIVDRFLMAAQNDGSSRCRANRTCAQWVRFNSFGS